MKRALFARSEINKFASYLNRKSMLTLICDDVAAFIMSKGLIDIAITGCDRVAENGDPANKIGTMGVAICIKIF